MSQAKINDSLTSAFTQFERTLPAINRHISRSTDATRLAVADLLAEYADNRGYIPKGRINALLGDLPAVERQIYARLNEAMRQMTEQSATTAVTSANGAIIAGVGIPALLALNGAAMTGFASGVAGTSSAFLIGIGVALAGIVSRILLSVFNRKGDDGLRLRDRFRNYAVALRLEIAKVIREGVRKGLPASQIADTVRKAYEDSEWKLSRLAETESMTAYRTAIAKAAEESGLVEGLRIVDHPHGDPAEHRRHLCYVYAHRNEYGMGVGVYPVGTVKIRNPHAQCRASLRYVMKDEYK